MEENKYYTPTIEEFHVGFEYEHKERFLDGTVKTQEDFDNSKWVKQTCDSGIMYIERALSGRNSKNGLCGVRVKYLDQEDIESLGFELEESNKKETIYRRSCDNLMTEKEVQIWVDKEFDYIDICNLRDKEDYNFMGKIKNKSELKRVLKMIGYE